MGWQLCCKLVTGGVFVLSSFFFTTAVKHTVEISAKFAPTQQKAQFLSSARLFLPCQSHTSYGC